MTPAVYNPRRPYYDDEPDGYQESDRDYLENNNDLAVALLDRYGPRMSLPPTDPYCPPVFQRAGGIGMKTIKVAEATQLQLNWLVAKVEGKDGVLHDDGITRCIVIAAPSGVYKGTYSPSIKWAQGGPIKTRERISTQIKHDGWWVACIYNVNDDPTYMQLGSSELVAAMRCYVTSKLGNTVEVPEELV